MMRSSAEEFIAISYRLLCEKDESSQHKTDVDF